MRHLNEIAGRNILDYDNDYDNDYDYDNDNDYDRGTTHLGDSLSANGAAPYQPRPTAWGTSGPIC